MAKPILIVKIHSDVTIQIDMQKFQNGLSEKFYDWHVWVLPVLHDRVVDAEFEAYHVGNATDVEIESLKEKILKEVKQITNASKQK